MELRNARWVDSPFPLCNPSYMKITVVYSYFHLRAADKIIRTWRKNGQSILCGHDSPVPYSTFGIQGREAPHQRFIHAEEEVAIHAVNSGTRAHRL